MAAAANSCSGQIDNACLAGFRAACKPLLKQLGDRFPGNSPAEKLIRKVGRTINKDFVKPKLRRSKLKDVFNSLPGTVKGCVKEVIYGLATEISDGKIDHPFYIGKALADCLKGILEAPRKRKPDPPAIYRPAPGVAVGGVAGRRHLAPA